MPVSCTTRLLCFVPSGCSAGDVGVGETGLRGPSRKKARFLWFSSRMLEEVNGFPCNFFLRRIQE